MLNREKIQFNYRPSYWPRVTLLGIAFACALLVAITPLAFSHSVFVISLLLLFTVWQWRCLQNSVIEQLLCMDQRWYIRLRGEERRIPVSLEDYSRPYVNAWVLVFSARPQYPRRLRVYIGRDNVDASVFTAICRQLLGATEVRRT